MSDSLPSQSRLFAITRLRWARREVEERARAGPRIAATLCGERARGRAGCARSSGPTGRRSSRSRRRPARPAVPPCRWKRRSPKTGIRWPTWSESAGRVEADVAGDRAPRREARRGCPASWRGGCPATRARQGTRRVPAASRCRDRSRPRHSGTGGPVLYAARSARSGVHPLHGIVPAVMQTSLVRRQRRRRLR